MRAVRWREGTAPPLPRCLPASDQPAKGGQPGGSLLKDLCLFAERETEQASCPLRPFRMAENRDWDCGNAYQARKPAGQVHGIMDSQRRGVDVDEVRTLRGVDVESRGPKPFAQDVPLALQGGGNVIVEGVRKAESGGNGRLERSARTVGEELLDRSHGG